MRQSSSKPHRPVVAAILNENCPQQVLDVPSGDGWLSSVLNYQAELDGLDLFESKPAGYHDFRHLDLDMGLPEDLPHYDAIVSCEGIEHLCNPGLFLTTARQHLKPNGFLILTTPNIWYPQAKLVSADFLRESIFR